MSLTIRTTVSEDDKHLKDVTSILFHNGKVFSGGEDGIIKVWSPDLKKITECQAHEVNVYHLAAIGDTLYSCSNDSTIQAWSTDSLEHKKTVLKHEDEVYRLYVDGNKLYSGDSKGMIGIFENDRCQHMCNLIEEVSDLIVKGNLIYTVRDRDLVITELVEGQKNCRFVTRKTVDGKTPMAIVGSKLCFASRSGLDICVHDNNKETQYKELFILEKAHDMIVIALCGDNGHLLYSGGWDKKVKCWDLDKKVCISTIDVGCYVNVLTAGPDGAVYAGGANGFMCRLN